MKELVGKTITRIYISDDKELLKFEINDGESVVYYAEKVICIPYWIIY